MQGERILRAAIHLARIRESSDRAHAYRIRTAKKLCDLLEAFIAEEVYRATSLSKSDEASLSWAEVAQCLELSKSAAYTRYGTREKSDARRTS